MNRITLLILAVSTALALPAAASAQVKRYPLESPTGLRLSNVAAEPVTFQGKKGLRVTMTEDAIRRFQSMTPEEQARLEQLASIDGL